ncbi:MAG TPA: CpsB/CapC family capsule biosynthesis tyrosine phosphatase [Gemmatimonadales bacterium]|nr:CpsB/CapC family capsule biosynthesis tyrosine phosphatase [Gemmatimonadales bacterium]
MIDLHSHLLPGVDDGSRSVEQSVKVLGELAAQGLTALCLTPHLRAAQVEAGPPAAHDRAFAALTAQAPAVPRLHRGAEVMLDRPLVVDRDRIRRVTLNGSRYILVEFPRMVAFETVTIALSRIMETGLVPLLAHPERYRCCSVEAAARWRSLGALMQVDGPTLVTSRTRGQRARDLVAAGLGDIIAGDNHGDDRSMAQGYQFLLAQDAAEQGELLARRNPAAILADGTLEPVPPVQIRSSWMQRLRQLIEGD